VQCAVNVLKLQEEKVRLLEPGSVPNVQSNAGPGNPAVVALQELHSAVFNHLQVTCCCTRQVVLACGAVVTVVCFRRLKRWKHPLEATLRTPKCSLHSRTLQCSGRKWC
jgi:hypothetical protein